MKRLSLTLATLLLLPAFVLAQEEKKEEAKPQPAPASIFPDKNLEAVVRQYVFEKRNNDQPLTEKDVENISTITGKNKGVKDLTGLEKCRSLALLDLEGNEIENLAPIKDLKNIQSLTLAKNKIKDIAPVAELTRLQYLQLEDNQVADLAPLAKLENLRSLYLSRNQITNIEPLKGLTKLWSLYLDGNQLTDIKPLAELKNLSSLGLKNNQIADLSALAGMTELRYLFLEGNQITDLSVLVEMAKKDAGGEQRFAPFWRVYLTGNPLSDAARNTQLPELKNHARVTFE